MTESVESVNSVQNRLEILETLQFDSDINLELVPIFDSNNEKQRSKEFNFDHQNNVKLKPNLELFRSLITADEFREMYCRTFPLEKPKDFLKNKRLFFYIQVQRGGLFIVQRNYSKSENSEASTSKTIHGKELVRQSNGLKLEEKEVYHMLTQNKLRGILEQAVLSEHPLIQKYTTVPLTNIALEASILRKSEQFNPRVFTSVLEVECIKSRKACKLTKKHQISRDSRSMEELSIKNNFLILPFKDLVFLLNHLPYGILAAFDFLPSYLYYCLSNLLLVLRELVQKLMYNPNSYFALDSLKMIASVFPTNKCSIEDFSGSKKKFPQGAIDCLLQM